MGSRRGVSLAAAGICDPTVERLPWPSSLAGMRCLDIGTMDDFWAFELERRGAASRSQRLLDATPKQHSSRHWQSELAHCGTRRPAASSAPGRRNEQRLGPRGPRWHRNVESHGYEQSARRCCLSTDAVEAGVDRALGEAVPSSGAVSATPGCDTRRARRTRDRPRRGPDVTDVPPRRGAQAKSSRSSELARRSPRDGAVQVLANPACASTTARSFAGVNADTTSAIDSRQEAVGYPPTLRRRSS
jgi:hypothetical protein